MVDYSKWNNLDSDSDSDSPFPSSSTTTSRGPVRLTSLPGKGCSVTIGPQGVSFAQKSQRVEELDENDEPIKKKVDSSPENSTTTTTNTITSTTNTKNTNTTTTTTASSSSSSSSLSSTSPSTSSINSSSQKFESYQLCTRKGYISSFSSLPYYWNQTSSEIFLYINITKENITYSKKNLRLKLSLYDATTNRPISPSKTPSMSSFSHRIKLQFLLDQEPHLEFSLAYPIKLEGDLLNEFDEPIEWAILNGPIKDEEIEEESEEQEDENTKQLKDSFNNKNLQRLSLNLIKINPFPGSIFWWDKIINEDTSGAHKIKRKISQVSKDFQEKFSEAQEVFLKQFKDK